MKTRSLAIGVLVLCIIVGAFLRMWNLGEESLWSDEAYTADFVNRYSITKMITGEKQDRVNPPLYYIVTKVWTDITDSSELNLRFPSAVFGILTIPFVFWLGYVLSRRYAVATVAAGFSSVSWYLVEYSQEARAYALLTVLAILHLCLLVQLLKKPKAPWWHSIGWIFVGVAGVYTHYAFWALLCAEGVYTAYVVITAERKLLWRMVVNYIAIGIGFIPWFVVSTYPKLIQSKSSPFWQPPFSAKAGWDFFSKAWFVLPNFPVAGAVIIAALVVLGVLMYRYHERKTFKQSFVLIGLVVVVPVLVFAFQGMWIDRYILFTIPLWYIVMSFLLVLPKRRFALVVVGLVCAVQSVFWYQEYYRVDQKEQWRQATTYLEQIDDGQGIVYVNKSFSECPWKYYYDSESKTKFLEEFSEKNMAQVSNSMEHKQWAVVVYFQPTDTKKDLLHVATEQFGKPQATSFGEITVYIFHK